MVTKREQQNTGEPGEKKGRVKIDKLKLNKETVKDLTNSEEKMVKGGENRQPFAPPSCYDTYVCETRFCGIKKP